MRLFPKVLLSALNLLLVTTVYAQPQYRAKPIPTANKSFWVDSVYNALNEEERIGQLFMVAAYSGGKNYNEELVTKLIGAHQVGGLIFMQGGPIRQAVLTNRYQRMAQTPLLIGMDAEWGLGMRLDSVKNFPRQMMLGATRDSNIVLHMATAIAQQCRRLGVHIDFAPDVDVNNDPANPVINSRSFGEEKVWVARLGRAYIKGLQKNGVMACAKHFPGHGNTNVDSHKDLPLISRSLAQLDSVELYPFRQAIAGGVKSVMVAHLEVPALDTAAHVPTTLSRNAITGLLKDRLHFNGLVITDALNMQGLTKYFPAGDADLRAFAAGNDILLFSQDVATAIGKIKNAIDSGIIPQLALEISVKKILAAKYDAGLASQWKDIDTNYITKDLNRSIDSVRAQVAKAAITIVKDDYQVLKKIGERSRIGYIGINATSATPLYSALKKEYPRTEGIWLPKGTKADTAQSILDGLQKYSSVVVAVHNVNFAPGGNYGLGDEAISFLQQAGCRSNVLVVLLGNAYAMQYFCGAGSVMVAYEDDTLTEQAVAGILLKKVKAKGKLPVTACINGQSICPAPAKLRVTLAPPAADLRRGTTADAGVLNQNALDKLDMFISKCVADGVFPGCRVLAARDGGVFYDRSFGYLDYSKRKKVDTNTLYDVASCTKVLATTISVMRLYEQGRIDLDKTIGDYLPAARGTNKAALKIRDILLHQAGLKGWIPFYKEILEKDGKIRADLYRTTQQPGYTIPVARNIYLRNDYEDTIWSRIYASGLDNAGKMVYSDLDFYFMGAIVQQLTGKSIDKYADDEFYKPMGLKRITYNPINKFDTTQIAPTESETTFRCSTLCGYVHDPGAAMMGGVAGHAGLFATAHDVGAIFQMLLNKGTYGGKRYLKAATVDLFTAYNSKISHRGLGFDKPLPEEDNGGPAGDRVSALAFGHQGFTGTCVWADPATGVVFVFLSNRVNPTGANTKINKLNVRTNAQDYIYEALGVPVDTGRPAAYKAQTGQ